MEAQLLVGAMPEKRLWLQGLTLAKELLPAFLLLALVLVHSGQERA